MIGATYYEEMSIALPGQVSDGSRYNIDGACVLADASSLNAGTVVFVDAVGSDGVKSVKKMTADKVPYGVAIRSHFATYDINGQAVYQPGDGVNVATVGRVWVRAKEDFTPGFGTGVYIDPTTGEVAKTSTGGSVAATGWTFAGGKTVFKSGGAPIYLVEVQLHQL